MGLSVESWEQLGRRAQQWEDDYSSLTLLFFPSSTSRSKVFRFSCSELPEMVPLRSFSLEYDELIEGDSYRAAVSGFLAQGLEC